MTTDTLRLADAYYMVAAHLENNGREQLRIAAELNRIADALCERNIKEAAPSPQPEPQP